MLGVDSPKQPPPTVPNPTPTPTRPRGMFRREDYWPYLFGVFVFAGLLAVPVIWSLFIDLTYGRLVAGSLVGCAVFAYAHTKDGQFSLGSFIVGYAVVLLMSLRVAAQSGTGVGIVPGGLLGLLLMTGGGWLGIGLGRATGVADALKVPSTATPSCRAARSRRASGSRPSCARLATTLPKASASTGFVAVMRNGAGPRCCFALTWTVCPSRRRAACRTRRRCGRSTSRVSSNPSCTRAATTCT